MDFSTIQDCEEADHRSEPRIVETVLPWYAAVPVIGLATALLWAVSWVVAARLVT